LADNYSTASLAPMKVKGEGGFVNYWELIFSHYFRGHPFFYLLIDVNHPNFFAIGIVSVVVSP